MGNPQWNKTYEESHEVQKVKTTKSLSGFVTR